MQTNYTTIVPGSLASVYDDSRIARNLAGWWSIHYELAHIIKLALRLGQLLRDGPRDDLAVESLTWHIVLRYSRCFDSGAAGRSVAMGIESVRHLGDPDMLSLHTGLIHRRHNTFAHPGGDCASRLVIQLIEPQNGHLHVAVDEEAPGPIIDPDQVERIVGLCTALRGVVRAKLEKTRQAHENDLKLRRASVIQTLRDRIGTHANPSQQAFWIIHGGPLA